MDAAALGNEHPLPVEGAQHNGAEVDRPDRAFADPLMIWSVTQALIKNSNLSAIDC